MNDSELLQKMTGVDLETARRIVATEGGLRGIAKKVLEGQTQDFPKQFTEKMQVFFELEKRRLREELMGRSFVRDPQSVLDYLYATLRDRGREVFKVLFLNKANVVIGEKDMFFGTVDETAVHTREVAVESLRQMATAVIFVHNHPSGRIQPSEEDKDITRKLQTALQTIGVKVLDHLIVGDNRYFSFSEHHMM